MTVSWQETQVHLFQETQRVIVKRKYISQCDLPSQDRWYKTPQLLHASRTNYIKCSQKSENLRLKFELLFKISVFVLNFNGSCSSAVKGWVTLQYRLNEETRFQKLAGRFGQAWAGMGFVGRNAHPYHDDCIYGCAPKQISSGPIDRGVIPPPPKKRGEPLLYYNFVSWDTKKHFEMRGIHLVTPPPSSSVLTKHYCLE